MKNSLKFLGSLLGATILIAVIVLSTSCMDRGSQTQEVTLEGVHLQINSATLNVSFPAGCTGAAPACTQARNEYSFLSIAFQPRDLPEGQMLAYKNLPAVLVTKKGGASVSHSLSKYDNVAHTLTLGFEVPKDITVSGLKWADLAEIPLNVTP